MLITFTTEHGLLVIRADDLRRIEDVQRTEWKVGEKDPIYTTVCIVEWTPNGTELCHADITGTAQENLDRVLVAESKAIAAYEDMQRRAQQGLPALPIVRGGKAARQ